MWICFQSEYIILYNLVDKQPVLRWDIYIWSRPYKYARDDLHTVYALQDSEKFPVSFGSKGLDFILGKL